MKTYFLFALLLLTACTQQGYGDPKKYVQDGENLINCTNKQDGTVILYYQSRAKLYQPDSMPVTIWYIVDVKGNPFSLNNYEIENYACSTVVK